MKLLSLFLWFSLLSIGVVAISALILPEFVQKESFSATRLLLLIGSLGIYSGALAVVFQWRLKKSSEEQDALMRKLETIRKDFVANVSHELKTPITSIKGFVETLLEGALDSREDALRFLQIILRQADRVTSIIEDLLTLSRLEQEGDSTQIPLERSDINHVARRAIQDSTHAAKEKGISIDFRPSDPLLAPINSNLLEQAILNLIDNAIKHSEERSRIVVSVSATEREIVIAVKDTGTGIAPEHLPRIFERFYRVDKARSRKGGGKGLGLSIVKHIAQVHKGQARVKSVVGEGSTFTIQIPRLHG